MDEKKIKLQMDLGCKITGQLGQNLHIAMSSWAHFEAIEGDKKNCRDPFRDSLFCLGLNDITLKTALIRDRLTALCRIVDHPKKTVNFSLADLSQLLDDKKLRDFLVSSSRVKQIAPRIDKKFDENDEIKELKSKISFIRDRIPKQWNNKSYVTDPCVYEWREKIWPLRVKILAHPGDTLNIEFATDNDVREGIYLIEELVDAAHNIFVGNALPGNKLEKLRREAYKFWDYAQAGFVEAFKQDRDQALRRMG